MIFPLLSAVQYLGNLGVSGGLCCKELESEYNLPQYSSDSAVYIVFLIRGIFFVCMLFDSHIVPLTAYIGT